MSDLQTPVTFGRLCRQEPRLRKLYDEARAVGDDGSAGHFCANAVWFGYGGHRGLKVRLVQLVGFQAEAPELRTTEAYDVAYQTIYAALPNCRGCLCA
jgi:hypothetical protein